MDRIYRIKNKFNFREIQALSLLFSESENLQIAGSLSFSRWRGIVVLRAD
jgi:hypothetical protein